MLEEGQASWNPHPLHCNCTKSVHIGTILSSQSPPTKPRSFAEPLLGRSGSPELSRLTLKDKANLHAAAQVDDIGPLGLLLNVEAMSRTTR